VWMQETNHIRANRAESDARLAVRFRGRRTIL
jgi:hypothetical protein